MILDLNNKRADTIKAPPFNILAGTAFMYARRVYIIGMKSENVEESAALTSNAFLCFNLMTTTWEVLPDTSYIHSGSCLIGPRLLTFGGLFGALPSDNIMIYSINDKKWSEGMVR